MSTSPMNHAMVKRLILMDWHFQRWAVAGYFAAGALSLVLVALGTDWSFYAGTILLFTALIALGIQLPMATIINERKEQNLAFVMSLPISPREYTIAKILANLLSVLLPWAALTLCGLGLLAGGERSAGLIPFAAVTLTEILVGACLLLAVALASESLGWTLTAMALGNFFFQGFLYYVSHIPSVAASMRGPRAVWSPAVISLLLAEIAAIVLLLGLAFFFQSRKTDFL